MIRDYKFSVYLDEIFIRNVVIKAHAWNAAEKNASVVVTELYPQKHNLLTIVRYYNNPHFELTSKRKSAKLIYIQMPGNLPDHKTIAI